MFTPTQKLILDMSPEEFEKYSLLVLKQQIQGIDDCCFEHNKIIKVSDGNYQIDGFIEFSLMGVTYKTLLECKHYKNSISREKVQILYDKLRACGAQKGILVSSSNFQSGAITYATKHGIALIQLIESGNQYQVRGMYNSLVSNQHIINHDGIPYIGVKHTCSQDGLIQCSYLTQTNLALKDFLKD